LALRTLAADAISGKPRCPVVTVAGQDADASSIPPHHHPIAVVLDLMNPADAARRLRSRRGQAWLDETGRSRAGTQKQRGHCANGYSRQLCESSAPKFFAFGNTGRPRNPCRKMLSSAWDRDALQRGFGSSGGRGVVYHPGRCACPALISGVGCKGPLGAKKCSQQQRIGLNVSRRAGCSL
jgi:hypothetical protein